MAKYPVTTDAQIAAERQRWTPMIDRPVQRPLSHSNNAAMGATHLGISSRMGE